MAKYCFGEIVKEVKDKVDRQNNPYEFYIAGDHMDTDELHLLRRGTFAGSDVGPAFIRLFRPGQVLYGSRRTYLRKVAVADFEGVTANTTFVLESKNESVLMQTLLPFIMQSERFVQHSINRSKGSTNPYVLFSDLADYELELPDLETQRKLSELLWAMDATRMTYKKLLSATDDLVKSQFMEQFGNEDNKKLLSDCAYIERGSVITRENVIPGDIPVVAAGIEPSCYHNVANRKANIISISASGANAGYVNYWNRPIFASDCNTVNSRNYDKLDNVFLYCRLRVMQAEIFSMQRGAGQPHVNGKDLAKIEVPIPSIDRQKEYSEFVRQSDKSKFELEQALTELNATYKRIIEENLC